ncbi:E3 ubiquitin-protein ligase DTX3L isoform X1 [Pleuronectes platessa]|uniref:E3 ubiquitin-protein ligase DTX3L isoform X1 n=1 Tax=Pleuronectes platessa TaxID=8262 RepID=UPI00232A0C9C|nr:E3 ubiquitin-protein ligase DTX3L isoform X1 [Pleuronectes platessa]
MKFITDITIIIDEADYTEPGRLRKILKSYSAEKDGSCYRVGGTFEELEDLSVRLSAVKHSISSATHGQLDASTHIKSIDVSVVVMTYIQQKCAKELNKIQGNSFVFETQPEHRTVNNNPSGTVQVIIRQQGVSAHPVHADYVRQRFITFYQRTASDLQVTSVPVIPQQLKDLQMRFPKILFKPSHGYPETATGPFLHIAQLKKFLLQNTQRSSESPVNKGSTETPSSRTWGPQPIQDKDPEDELCPICMEPIAIKEKQTLQCKHSFCKDCFQKAYKYKPVCPTCGKIYGTLTGTQPDGGKMKTYRNSSSLPGYEKYGTITIHYDVQSGIQEEEHPNPGQPFEGVFRTAYLPDSSEGRRILGLLRRAFDQRLIFTVGRSTTTGRNNIVTWNDIHHKTSTHGGPTCYGYPDPDYLSRVGDELKLKGID